MKQPKILVVGSINTDLIVYGAPAVYPARGGHINCKGYAYAFGGKGANQACTIAKLGAQATLVVRIGDDTNGADMIEELNRRGVDTRFVTTMDTAATGLSILCTEEDGCYHAFGIPGANQFLHADDVETALAAEHFDMVLLQLEMPLETAYRTYELARAHRIPTMLDAGPTMAIPLDRFYGIHILSPNEAEANALTGVAVVDAESALCAAKRLQQDANADHILLKMGERGVFYYDGTQYKRFPANRVKAVDTAGAGDTFNAALCMKLCQGEHIFDAIHFAQKAAALSVMRRGAIASVPTMEEIEAANFVAVKGEGDDEFKIS